MKKNNKILLFSALGILGVGVASTVCWSIVKTHESQKESKQIIKEDQFDLKEGELLRFEKSSKNMLAAKTATYYKNVLGYGDDKINEEIENIVGTYNSLYDDSIEQNKDLYKEGLVGSIDDANYVSLNMINNEFNINPIDLDKNDIETNDIQQIIKNENEEYKEEIFKKMNMYESEVEPMISKYNLDNIEATLWSNSLDKETKEEKDLQAIANLIRTKIGNTITIRDDIDSNFASKLKVYSTDGNTGYFAANNNDPIDDLKGISVNDLIDANDMGDLFNMEYDLTQNTIFKETPDNVDYEATNEECIDIAEDEIVAPFIQKLPMSGISIPGGASYAPGECYPGYQLLTRIVNEDYITNSNYDTITLKFGVWDMAYDMDQEHVIWLEDDLNMTANINVASISQKRNIANNYFYTQMETIPCNDFYDEENKEYFKVNQEESNRATINEVLDAAPVKENGEYDINESNPYYIDPNSVNLEGISVPEGSWYYNGGHTNEKLKLKVVDVNTNVNGDNNQALKCIWSICDTDPQTGEYVWVKDIQWVNHNEPIWINFNYNEEDLNKITYATMFCDSVKTLNDFIEQLNDGDINNITNKAKDIEIINLTCEAVAIATSVILDITSAYMISISPLLGITGVLVLHITMLIILSVFDIGFAIWQGFEAVAMVKATKNLEKARDQWNLLCQTFDMDLISQMVEWDSILNNSRYNIQSKLSIYDKLEEIEQTDIEKWNNFEEQIARINGSNDSEVENIKSHIQNPNMSKEEKILNKKYFYSINSVAMLRYVSGGYSTLINILGIVNPSSEWIRTWRQQLQHDISVEANVKEYVHTIRDHKSRAFWDETTATVSCVTEPIGPEAENARQVLTSIDDFTAAHATAIVVCPVIIKVCTVLSILSMTAKIIATAIIKEL